MTNSDHTVSLLRNLNFDFIVNENASTEEYAFLRTKFKTEEDVSRFIEKVQRLTNTKFSVRTTKPKVKRSIFHKTWVCQHSSFRKKDGSKKDIGCTAFINVRIKKVNEYTQRNDKFLKMMEPLPCVIKINLKHSHSLENHYVLGKLPVAPEIIKEFEGYFESGYTVALAQRFHEDKLIARHDFDILNNSTYNPTDRQAHYIYEKWKHKLSGQVCRPLNSEQLQKSSIHVSSENSKNSILSQETANGGEIMQLNEVETSNLNLTPLPKSFKLSEMQELDLSRPGSGEEGPETSPKAEAAVPASNEKNKFEEKNNERKQIEHSLKVTLLEKEHALKMNLLRRKHYLKAQLLKKQIELKNQEINVQKKTLEILETNPQNLTINFNKSLH